ncbi:NAD-dependent epimerase/dehydratase family protein [Carnobacterium gallinarum]|uniref:NAD-dependent epimerase/dehydratase family protein n=1 Tax=Carnobacterium gallinarum TaxID=2749 RepID=UPI000555D202|nr:NAD-dependent epimerase/dehydratase family protein [Carnobacterium gallinarum]
MTKVLVTGGTGFVASWTIKKLLEKSYEVRATIRSENKADNIKSMLTRSGAPIAGLSFAIADLNNSQGWEEAMEGIDYVLHIASPLGSTDPNESSIIETAKNGTIHVVTAALQAKVKKIVMTSSLAAATPLKKVTDKAVDETFWTDPMNPELNAYRRSKVIAEQAAWALVKTQEQTSLTTILPGAIFGPLLDKSHTGSVQFVQTLLKGGTPSAKIDFEIVDVRDLADLHILAMENDKANGQRYIAESENLSMKEIAGILHDNMGEDGKKVSLLTIPNIVLKVAAKVNPALGALTPMLNRKFQHTNHKAKSELSWQPKLGKETIIATGESLIEFKLI